MLPNIRHERLAQLIAQGKPASYKAAGKRSYPAQTNVNVVQ